MRIILKYIYTSMKEKKFRTFLIVFAVMMSSALLFASLAMTDTLTGMFVDRYRTSVGQADIVVRAGDKAPSPWVDAAPAEHAGLPLTYLVGTLSRSATLKMPDGNTKNLRVLGITPADLRLHNPVPTSPTLTSEGFTGHQIVLSRALAEELGLAAGDSFTLTLSGAQRRLTLAAVAEPAGIFTDESQSASAIVPPDLLNSLSGVHGKTDTLHLRLMPGSDLQAALSTLKAAYPEGTRIDEAMPMAEIRQNLSSMSVAFLLMTVIVLLISIFIIYSSFRVVTLERLPVIGTFRSIGATRKQTSRVLLLESGVYGLIGGAAGCVLGIGILLVLANVSKPAWISGLVVSLKFSPMQLLAAFLLGVILPLISCWLPVRSVSRIPVKDVVLGTFIRRQHRMPVRSVAGLVLIALSVILPPPARGAAAMPVSVIAMVLGCAGIVFLVPALTHLAVRLTGGLATLLFRNVGGLAVKNARNNPSLFNNISLLAIGMSGILMITVLSASVAKEVVNVYSTLHFDIWTEVYDRDSEFIRALTREEGVSGAYDSLSLRGVSVEGTGKSIAMLHGVDISKHTDYWAMAYEGNAETLMQSLAAGRNILLTFAMRDALGVRTGDTLQLRSGNQTVGYTVSGFFNTLMENGQYAMISDSNMRQDFRDTYTHALYLRTRDDPARVQKAINSRYAGKKSYWISNIPEMEQRNMKSNNGLFNGLTAFSVVALVIGVFGVFNNLMISFIERRRHLAVLRSVGMSRRQLTGMIFVESLNGGILGGICGCLAGLILLYDVGFVLKAMSLPVALHFTLSTFCIAFVSGIVITLVASVSPALKSSRLNLVSAIKYE